AQRRLRLSLRGIAGDSECQKGCSEQSWGILATKSFGNDRYSGQFGDFASSMLKWARRHGKGNRKPQRRAVSTVSKSRLIITRTAIGAPLLSLQFSHGMIGLSFTALCSR